MAIEWLLLQGSVGDQLFSGTPEQLVFVNSWLSEHDPRSAKEQLNEGYAQYGGWRPMKGFTMKRFTLLYPGDPPMRPVAMGMLRDEVILIYPADWVVVAAAIAPITVFEVCRMD